MPYACLDALLLPARWPLPADASQHGRSLDQHLLLNLTIVLGLAALAHLLLATGLLLRPAPEARSDQPHKRRLQYLPLLALAILFAGLGLRAERLWAATHYTGPDMGALQVEVTGMQFVWYFRYPGPDAIFGRTDPTLVEPGAGNPLGLDPADAHGKDDVTASELVLPAGREVDLRLRAQDVIHGFAIPEMRLKQNAIPGSTQHIHFTPTTPGTYAVLCTQLCGLGHYRMNATVRVLPEPEYTAWLASREKPVQP